MQTNLYEKTLKTIRNYDMLKPGDTVLVGVSGGPDSVFLLHSLDQLKTKLRLKDLVVCHLDHGVRGKESKEDLVFVRKMAEFLGLEFAGKSLRLNRQTSKKLSIEELLRRKRYEYFRTTAARFGANVVATGHTLDDQAETMVMRLIKGSSLKGLLGVPPVREEKDISIIRPLLEITKDEIVLFLKKKGLKFRIDRTNLEPVYFRNVVRHEIIPFLEKFNPRFKRVLFNLSQHLLEDFQFIEERRKSVASLIIRQGGFVRIWLKDISAQPQAVKKEMLRSAFDMAGGEVKRLSFRHWKEMENLIDRRNRGCLIDLPGSIRMSKRDAFIVFYRI